jgi:hypothetical protein
MKIALACVVAALALQEPVPMERAERIRLAIEWLSDPDPQLRAAARTELLAWGREAVPRLEELLQAKGALEVYRIVREIELGKSVASELPRPLPSDDEFLRRIGKADGTTVDAYVRSKMADARQLHRDRQYQKAYDLVNAILVLEPKSRYAVELNHMRRVFDNMVTQTSIVKTRVIPASMAAAAGSKVDVVLRMENAWKGGITLQYDKEIARPMVIVEIVVERLDPNGSVTRANRTEEFPIAREIPIAMGAQWELPITLDTSLEFSDDQDYLRTYTVGAWMPVVKIDRGMGIEVQKRVFFEPVSIKLVPRKHLHLAEDPLGKLGKAMDSASVNEVFICAMLLPDDQKPQGVELLVSAMEKAAENLKKAQEKGKPEEQEHLRNGLAIIGNILTTVTGEKRGMDIRKWRQYAESLKSSAKKGN